MKKLNKVGQTCRFAILLITLCTTLATHVQAAPVRTVMTDTNGVIVSPTNFVSANGLVDTNRFETNAAAVNAAIDEKLSEIPEANTLFVTTDGDDATGSRGKRNKPFASFGAANSNALSGDLIKFGAGTFTQTNTVNLKDGVSVVGASEATVIYSTNDFAITITNSNHILSDFKIDGFQGIGTLLSTQSVTATNIILRDITMQLDGPDALSFWSSGVTNKHEVQLDGFNLSVESTDITDYLVDTVATTNSLIRLFNCKVVGGDAAVLVNSGRVELFDGYFKGKDFGAVTDGGELSINGSKVRSDVQENLFNSSGTLTVANADYESSSGPITGTNRAPEIVAETGNFNALNVTNNATIGKTNTAFYFVGNGGGLTNVMHTPASSAETNAVGTIRWDADYIYVWTATNVVKRAALSTW